MMPQPATCIYIAARPGLKATVNWAQTDIENLNILEGHSGPHLVGYI